jgi:hypothetical protein
MRELYKDTFSKLNASEGTLSEVLKMTDKRKRISIKALLVAAVLAVALSATAFAYGSEIVGAIQQFMFGDSSIKQVEKVGSDTTFTLGDGTVVDGDIAVAMEIVNRVDYAWNHDREYTSVMFSTYREANQSAPFVIKEPSYIPANATLEKIAVPQFEDKTYGYDIRITYNVDLPNGNGSLGLFQYYAGSDAYLNMQTVEGIQKVMVGSIEASIVNWGDWGTHLYWIQDEIVFELFSFSYDLDTLVKIAESMK